MFLKTQTPAPWAYPSIGISVLVQAYTAFPRRRSGDIFIYSVSVIFINIIIFIIIYIFIIIFINIIIIIIGFFGFLEKAFVFLGF